MYDLVIIGGGPAGVGAGVYAARKKIKTVLIADSFGGQSIVSNDVQNWIGMKSVTGLELAKMLEEHLRSYQSGLDIWDNDLVVKIEKAGNGFIVSTKNGKTAETKTILVCSGGSRRRLGVPGEDKLDGKGVAWCATCDAPLFGGKTVAVVGGGNSGLESAIDLNSYADKLYLLHRGDKLKGDLITQEKILAMSKITVIYNAVVQEILGDKLVTGLRYKDIITGEERTLEVGGVFIEVGNVPNSAFIKDLVKTNDFGEIIADARTQQSSAAGIWAAGDVSDVKYKQNNISVGDAILAVLNIFDYLHRQNNS